MAIEKIQIFKGKQLTIGLDLGANPSYTSAKKETALRKDCGWKDGDRGGPAKTQGSTGRKKEERRKTVLTHTGLLMEGVRNGSVGK
jgi:hypothetical protein